MNDQVQTCQLCDRSFQWGHENWPNGKHFAIYNLTVCKICIEGNWDGLSPALEARFEQHCAAEGIELPARNKLGLYPLDS